MPLLQFEYLHKGTFLGAEIFGIFITHLGLHTGKISLKSVRSIEHVFCHLGRPYRAMAPRDFEGSGGASSKSLGTSRDSPGTC